MALAPLDIANQALSLLGAGSIASIPTSYAATDTIEARTIFRQYERAVKSAMARLDPSYLRHTAALAYSSVALTLATGAVIASESCTAASATWLDGCKGQAILEVDADGVDGSGVSEIIGYTSSTVVTIETTTAWDDATPAANRWRLVPRDYSHEYVLPADCLTIRGLDDSEALWTPVSQRRLWADVANAVLTYTRYDEDPDNWDTMLQDASVYAVAAACAYPITKQHTIVADMVQLAEGVYAQAAGQGFVEQQPREPVSGSLLRDVR